ncbi:MAG TPA: FAD-binding oxidoreductase [Solirubrobacter sp.]|nr:FAD-binding oxidoreductase [Solirubrobacter sp.]
MTDVLIIGGGVAGAALAYELARRGVAVTLLERGELNREASGTNAGSLHLQIAIHQLAGALDTAGAEDRLREETRLAAEGARLWREFGDVHVTGGLMVAETPEQLRLLHDKQRIEAAAGLETRVLEGEELRAVAPWLSEAVIGGSYCPEEGHVNPLTAGPELARRAAEHDAVIRTHAGVREIEPLGDSFRVRTAAGMIVAQRVVNAAGAWAGAVGRLVGLQLPLRALGLHVNVTEPRPRLLEPLVQHMGRRLTLKQASNGTFIIGGGWPAFEADGRYATAWRSAAGNAAVAVDVVPALADVRLLRTWSGVIAWTHDVAPIVGESQRVPGFHALVAGSSGYTLSPLLARRLAEQMTGGAPLAPEYSPDRVPAVTPA